MNDCCLIMLSSLWVSLWLIKTHHTSSILRWSIVISLYGLNLISNPIKCWNIVSAPSRVSSPAHLKEMTPYCASEAADGKVQRASISQPTPLRCAHLDINLKRTNIESGGRPTLTSCKWYEMSREIKKTSFLCRLMKNFQHHRQLSDSTVSWHLPALLLHT